MGTTGSPSFSPFGTMMEGVPNSACGVCNKLWADSKQLVASCLLCPFVVALGQGGLPR